MKEQRIGFSLESENCGVCNQQALLMTAQAISDGMWEDEDYDGENIVGQLWGQTDEEGSYDHQDDAWFTGKSFEAIMDRLWVFEHTKALTYTGLMEVNEQGALVSANDEHEGVFWGTAIVDVAGCYAFGHAYDDTTDLFTGPCPIIDTMFDALRRTRKMTQWRRAAVMMWLKMNSAGDGEREKVVEELVERFRAGDVLEEETFALATEFDALAMATASANGLVFDRPEDAEKWLFESNPAYSYGEVRAAVLAKVLDPYTLGRIDEFDGSFD
jgi:hypothetical protein